MRDTLPRRSRWLVAAGLFAAGVAWASPWDIDMINGINFKAFEWRMRATPAGTVQARPQGPKDPANYQTDYVAAVDRTSPTIDTLANPFPADEAALAEGKHLFEVTCTPCHGPLGKGGGPVTQNDPAKNIRRYPIPAPMLSGAGSVSALRSDGYLYATIRNGGALMPAYGTSLTEHERWSVVSYIRTLEGAAWTPPAPVEPTGELPK